MIINSSIKYTKEQFYDVQKVLSTDLMKYLKYEHLKILSSEMLENENNFKHEVIDYHTDKEYRVSVTVLTEYEKKEIQKILSSIKNRCSYDIYMEIEKLQNIIFYPKS